MTAEIETFAYTKGHAPWWNEQLESIGAEAKTNWEKFCEAAGLNWSVEKQPLYLLDTDAQGAMAFEQVEEGWAVVRQSDRKVLGVVGPKYEPFQNSSTFSWFDPFLQSGVAELETAGSLKGGRVVFAQADIAQTEAIRGNDVVMNKILLSNSHDGSLAIRAGFCRTRVVCWNTLNMAFGEGQLFRVRHTKSAEDTLNAIRDTMVVAEGKFRATADQYRTLAKANLVGGEDALKNYITEVYELDKDDLSKRASNMVDQIISFAQDGIGNDGSSWWDAFNGITQYVTHEAGRTPDSRLASQWFGDGAKINNRALDKALVYVGVAA